jgi:hypothetical protein
MARATKDSISGGRLRSEPQMIGRSTTATTRLLASPVRKGCVSAVSRTYRNRLPCGEPVAVGKTWRVALSTI